MANVANRDPEDLEGHQARTVFLDLLDRPVNAAWMDFQGLLFRDLYLAFSLLPGLARKINDIIMILL